jgi:membrane protein DedA with SNARE-associated domain
MTLESSIETYGYLAVLIGSFLEGETVLVLGGFAAQRGYLQLPWVILVAFIGSLTGDQLYFHLGRWHNRAILSRHPAWQEKVVRIHDILFRYKMPVIVGFRFIYGFRVITPFAIGMSRIRTAYFTVLNFIGALIWAIIIGCAGYFFGNVIEVILGDLRRYEIEAMAVIAFAGAVLWLVHVYRRGRVKAGHIKPSIKIPEKKGSSS